MGLDVEKIRQDFPILQKKINGKPIIYMDSACMTLRPVQVIEKIKEYYTDYPACGERSLHKLGRKVDENVEKARETLRKFINAKNSREIIFTKNTTEGINLVAHSFKLDEGDVVLGTDKEHNSNLLPWQAQALSSKGVKYDFVESNADNTFSIENFMAKNPIKRKYKYGDLWPKIDNKVKLVAMVLTSNLDGTSIPAKEVIKLAHDNGQLVLLDAAQAVPHHDVDVRKLDVDFLAFSGHKMLGPSGTGVLYGKERLLDELSPFMVGGGTVIDTTREQPIFEELPNRFEAGLQDYAGIIGLGEAANYIMRAGRENIEKHETALNKTLTEGIASFAEILGPADPAKRSGVVSFNIPGVDPHDVAMMLDEMENICVRSGAHCVHSWFNTHNLRGSVRASLYLYNTLEECTKFIDTMKKVKMLTKK
jgi:cysteine desulfurase/selenocysteine lyase